MRPHELFEDGMRRAFDHAPIGMAVLDMSGVVVTCNAALTELLGRSVETITGYTLFVMTHPDDVPEAKRHCELMQAGALRISRLECRLQRTDGSFFWALISAAMAPEEPGQPAYIILQVEDIADRKALELDLRHRALHDPLTGLANRALLAQSLDDALARHPSCLLFVDLDGFKGVNDRHGHIVGDQLLQQLAVRFTASLRPQDVCARIGGDEFVVLCVATEPLQAEAIAERLRAVVAEPFAIDGLTINVTATIGMSASGSAARTATDAAAFLLSQADRRMYEAKRRREG